MKVKLYLFFALVLFGIFLIQTQGVSALIHITDCNGLSDIRNNLAENYVLDNDINCGGFGNFIPIGGNGNAHFSGTLDGKGYKIIGLSITSSAKYVGLFGQAIRATFKNFGLSNLNILSSSSESFSYTGGLLGASDGVTIENVWASGTVTFNNLVDSDCVGGLVGYGVVSARNSYSKVNVITNGESWVCRGTSGTCKVGGFIGKATPGSSFTNCYSTGAVNTEAGYRGGFAGVINGNTVNCYSTGAVTLYGGNGWEGGFCGWKDSGVMTSNYWDKTTSGYATDGDNGGAPCATGKSTAEMKTQTTFTGWDFDSSFGIWYMTAGDYPRLWFEYVPNLIESMAPSFAKLSQAFSAYCNYGKRLSCVRIITDSGGTCNPISWEGNRLWFSCLYNSLGTKFHKCTVFDSGFEDPRCRYNIENPIQPTGISACSGDADCSSLTDSCNDGKCNTATGCYKQPKTDGYICNDNNLCTLNDACSTGVCTGTAKCTGVQDCDSDNGECFDKHFCSSENDIIMKLNKPKNSLGSLWNEQGSYDICYSDIFGATLGIPNAHDCFGGTNPLMYLNSNKNSLASIQNNPFFPNPVCYGGLLCRNVYDATAGLVADYPLDTASIDDVSGNGNHGTGNAINTWNGKFSKAYDFNGIDQYVKLPASDSLNIKGDITISVWVNHRANQAASIVHKEGHYSLYVDGSGQLSWADSSNWNYLSFGYYGDFPADSLWHHLVVTKKGSHVIIYMDKNVVVGKFFGGPLTANPGTPFIGCYGGGAGGASCSSSYFNGIIDEVKIFNRALSSGEILDLYDNSLHVENCAADEKTVVGLKESSDSKISISTDNTAPFKICCKNPPPTVQWMNMIGEEISEANVSDSVNMVLKEIGISGNRLNFTVYNAAGDIKMSQMLIPTDFTGASVIFVPSEDGTYKFSVNNLDKGKILISSDLKISGVENSMPSVRIIEPVNEAHYLAGELINFTQESKDVDDDLKIIWDFGDGDTRAINNILTSGNGDTNHTYTASGTRLVKARVQEMTRGQRAEDSSKIYLHKEGINIFALIDNPNFSSAVVPDFYNVNGSSSFVEECVRGSCPAGTCYTVADLYCYGLEDSSKLTFNWTIDGKAFDYVKDNKNFSYFFDGPQEHVINLAVNYTYSGTNIFDKTSVKLLVSGIKCIDGGYHWINGTDPLNPIISNTARNCFIPDANSLIKTCCPRGYSCDFDDATTEYFCNYTGEMYCWDIADESSCLSATHATVDYTFNFLGTGCGNGDSYILGGRSCYDKIECSCEWNSVNNNCSASSVKTQCFNPAGPNPAELCEYILLSWDDQCNETGFIFVKVEATYTGAGASPPECNGVFDKTITCDQVVKLNFFGFWNFIASVLALMVIYGIRIKYSSKKYGKE